jgi:16S rRNA (cytosine1402-N4)-methyltransferase
MKSKRPLISMSQVQLVYKSMFCQNVISAVWCEPPAWLALNARAADDEADSTEDPVYHRPVLQPEVLRLLKPKSGSLIVDATCGGGGHTEALLESGADVLALDQDPDAVQHVTERLAHFGRRVIVRQANFRHAGCVLDELGIRTVGGILLDLGVSSRQLENAARGFSFVRNGPVDMRMDPTTSLTAATIVNQYSEEQLTQLFRELGEEPAARRIASLIVKMRKTSPFRETLPLARAIEKLIGRHGRQHPATQVFQALRMEVNDELGALEQGLRVLVARLAPGARIAVISFHSLEDRIVKNFFRDHGREWLDKPEWPAPQRNPDYDLKLVTPKPMEPSDDEQRANPRSRSAKLRVAEKIK